MFWAISFIFCWLLLVCVSWVCKLSPHHSGGSAVVTLFCTLIGLQPSNVFSRLFPCWVLQLRSENCECTLVTAVLFSSWPWVMYCFHYLPMYLGCSLCSVLILCCCLSVCLAPLQVWAAKVEMNHMFSCWSVASGESRTPSTCWRFFQVEHAIIMCNTSFRHVLVRNTLWSYDKAIRAAARGLDVSCWHAFNLHAR